MIETDKEEEFDVTDGFVKAIRLMAFTCLLFAVIICGLFYALKSFETKTTVNAKPVSLSLEGKCQTFHIERATTYQATTAQCDSNPLTTADGSRINPDNYQRWVALSRDLLSRWGGEFNYSDTIEVYSKEHPNLNEPWEVHDCMSEKYTMSIDFLLEPEKNYPKLGIGKDVKILICND